MKEIKQNSFLENTETNTKEQPKNELNYYDRINALDHREQAFWHIILIFINFGFLFSFIMVFLKG